MSGLMKMLICAFLVLILATSCTRVHNLELTQPEELEQLEQLSRRHPCTVRSIDGTKYKARFLLVDQDSTSWTHLESRTTQRIATHQIREIRFVRRGKGLVEGLGLGFITGACMGGAIGVMMGSSDDSAATPPHEDFLFGAAALGIPMALIGGIIGPLSGSKDLYYFILPESLSVSVRARE